MHRLFTLTLFLVGTSTFLLTTAKLVTSRLKFDETEFAEQAEATYRYGAPRIPPSVDHRVSVEAKSVFYEFENKYDQRYGMWHPPLYLHSLALVGSLTGFDGWGIRSTGLLCFAVSLLLVKVVINQVGAPPRSFLLAIGLIGLSPLLVEGATFVDIDNTVLTTTLLVQIVLFIRYQDRLDLISVSALSVAFCLSLWAKLTTPLMLLTAFGIYQVVRGKLSLAACQVGLTGILGGALFAGTYALYCVHNDYPWFFMFDNTFVGRQSEVASSVTLIRVLQSLRWHVVWTSPAVTLAVLATLCLRLRSWLLTRRIETVDLLVIFATVGTAGYVLHAGIMGKYCFPIVLALIIVVSYELGVWLERQPLRMSVGYFALAAGLSAMAMIMVPNLQEQPRDSILPGGLTEALSDPRAHNLIVALLLPTILGIAGRWLWPDVPIAVAFLFGVCVAAVAINPVDVFKGHWLVPERSPYSASARVGLGEVVTYLQKTCEQDDIILADRTIGHHFGGKYIPEETVSPANLPETSSIRLYVYDSYLGTRKFDPSTIGRVFREVRIGDYVVCDFRKPLE